MHNLDSTQLEYGQTGDFEAELFEFESGEFGEEMEGLFDEST